MKNGKKVVSILFTVILLLSVAACGNPSAGDSTGQSSSASTEAGKSGTSSENSMKEWPEIEIWAGYVRDFAEVTKVQEQWKEKLGFNVRVKNVTGEVETALNLVLASGGFKDMAVLDKNNVLQNNILKSGSVMEVTDILANKAYPNLSSIPQQYLNVSKESDGKHWYIPTNWDIDPDDPWPGWTRDAFMISDDILAKTGIAKESIKSLADYENFLRAVSKLAAPDGSTYIPTTFTDSQIKTILTAFGVKTGTGSGSVIAVDKVGDDFLFLYDNPNFKRAYQWVNKLIREELIDAESVIQKTDILKEKVYSGKYASLVGFVDFNPTKPGDPYRSFNPIPFPLPEGVEKPGVQYIINPYPKSAAYISKNTKNLDAILAFMDWALEPVPERHFELNEGLEGINWHWADKPYGAWEFEPAYEEARNNPATRTALQPEMYMLGTLSREWYPWWTKKQPADAAQYVHVRINSEVFGYGTHATIHSWDFVKAEPGSKWDKYGATLSQVGTESTAKLLLSKSENEFEANWTEFLNSLETKAHWSELKEEWYALYQKQTAVAGEW